MSLLNDINVALSSVYIIRDSIKKLNNAELDLAVADLISNIADLKINGAELKEQVADLKTENLNVKQELKILINEKENASKYIPKELTSNLYIEFENQPGKFCLSCWKENIISPWITLRRMKINFNTCQKNSKHSIQE